MNQSSDASDLVLKKLIMIISELKILIDLNKDHVEDVLSRHCKKCNCGYFFIDSDDGSCHLFDENGDEDDISNIKCICENIIPKDIKKIVIPDSVESIGDWVFSDCISLTTITIPNSVKRIKMYAFFNCTSLTTMTIPNSVKYIGYAAFSYCTSLKTISIPNSVEIIRYAAFFGCKSLEEVIFKNKIIDEVKSMKNYPFGIEDESIIKCNLIK